MPAAPSLADLLTRAIEAAAPGAGPERRLGEDVALAGLFAEVEDTVLPRHLLFASGDGGALEVEARGRRIVAITDPVSGAEVRAGPGGAVAESVAALGAMRSILAGFAGRRGPFTVRSSRSRLPASAVDPGFAPEQLAEVAESAPKPFRLEHATPPGPDPEPDAAPPSEPATLPLPAGEPGVAPEPSGSATAVGTFPEPPETAENAAPRPLVDLAAGTATVALSLDRHGGIVRTEGDGALADALAAPVAAHLRALAREAEELLPEPRLIVMMRRAAGSPALCMVREGEDTAAALVRREEVAALVARWALRAR